MATRSYRISTIPVTSENPGPPITPKLREEQSTSCLNAKLLTVHGNGTTPIPIQIESARSLAGALRTGRRAAFTIYGKIVGAKEREINYYPRKTLELEVTRMEVELDSGRGHVGSKDIAAAGGSGTRQGT